MLEINGVELELDILDADMAERYETVTEHFSEDLAKLDLKSISTAEAMRQQCYLVFDYFDALFGQGTAKAIFGEKTNLGHCVNAMEQVTRSVTMQRQSFEERLGKYRPNRAQRRAKE